MTTVTTNTPLLVGTLSAEPGSKTRGTLPVDLGTLTVDVPLTLVNGTNPGPCVLITAGVHGGEFSGIDAATRLAGLLEPGEVHGQVVICPVANPPAVYQGRLGVSPVDGVNINRVFPGDPEGGPTERLAAWLFANLVDGADAYVDLHSGGIDEVLKNFVGYRLTGDPELDAKTADMAGAVGIEDVIFGLNADGGNSHAAAARQGVPAILVETGQLGERDADTSRRLVDGLYGVLGRLGVLETKPQDDPGRPRLGLGRRRRLRGDGPVVPGVRRRRRRDGGPAPRQGHRPGRRHRAQGPRPGRRADLLRHARPDRRLRRRTGRHRRPRAAGSRPLSPRPPKPPH